MLNRTGLIPPYSGNASDGFSVQPEPKSFTEELAEAESRVLTAAQKDVIVYSVDNAVNSAGHNIRAVLNIRHNLPFKTIDRLIAEMQPLVGPAIEKAKAELVESQKERVRFENLVGQFTALGLQIQLTNDRYDLLGLTESQLRMCADVLGTETPQTVARRKDGKSTATQK